MIASPTAMITPAFVSQVTCIEPGPEPPTNVRATPNGHTLHKQCRKFLLTTAMVITATMAHASSYWTSQHTKDAAKRNSCFAYTRMINGGLLGIGINDEDQELYTYIHKPTWHIPRNQELSIGVSVDNSDSVSAPAHVDPLLSSTIIIPVKPEYVRLFVHLVTAGDRLFIQFHGTEPDWNISLEGSSDAYNRFFDCAKRVAPDWTWRYRPRPTQPYDNTTNTQPYDATRTDCHYEGTYKDSAYRN